MRLANWLNSLSGADQIIILLCFASAIGLAVYLLRGARQLYQHLQSDNPYALKFRLTPAIVFAAALPLTILLYLLFGRIFSGWLANLLP